MRLKFALIALATLGGAALPAGTASAMPIGLATNADIAMNMNMDMVMNMDMAIAVGDFRVFGPLFFFETYVRDVALRDLAPHRHRPLSLRRIVNR